MSPKWIMLALLLMFLSSIAGMIVTGSTTVPNQFESDINTVASFNTVSEKEVAGTGVNLEYTTARGGYFQSLFRLLTQKQAFYGYADGYEAFRWVFLVTHVIPMAAITIGLVIVFGQMISRVF